MSRKISVLSVILCVALFGVGSTLAVDGGAVTGGPSGAPSMDISSPAESVEDTGTASPTDGEIEDEDEPILTVQTDLWSAFKSAAAVVDILFGPGSGTTTP